MEIDIYEYDTSIFDFRGLVSRILEVEDLENIHKNEEYDVLTREQDQSTSWHTKFYENKVRFNQLYYEFIRQVVKPIFENELIVYQTTPTFRVHLNGNVSLGEFHKDSDYGHPKNEINFWIPFTDTFSTNTIWVESHKGLGNYTPKSINYGEMLKFDGANYMYGNKVNDTGISVLSIDFRVIKYSDFVPSENTTINTNLKFDIGEYYSVI